MKSALAVINRQLRTEGDPEFDRIRLDTAANRRLVMRRSQNLAYNGAFGPKVPSRRSTGKALREFEGAVKVVGELQLQVPFETLGILSDVVFR